MSNKIKLLKARTELADKRLTVAELLKDQRKLEKEYFKTRNTDEKTYKLKQLITINERIVEAKRTVIIKYKELTQLEVQINGKAITRLNKIN